MNYTMLLGLLLLLCNHSPLVAMSHQEILQSDLIRAVVRDEIQELTQLFLAGANPNICSKETNPTALAIILGKPNALEKLLNTGGDPEAGRNLLDSSLFRAIKTGNYHCLKLLIEYGIEKDPHIDKILSRTIKTGNNKILDLLLEHNYISGKFITSSLLDECIPGSLMKTKLIKAKQLWITKRLKDAAKKIKIPTRGTKRTYEEYKEDQLEKCALCQDSLKEDITSPFTCTHNIHTQCHKDCLKHRYLQCSLCKADLKKELSEDKKLKVEEAKIQRAIERNYEASLFTIQHFFNQHYNEYNGY